MKALLVTRVWFFLLPIVIQSDDVNFGPCLDLVETQSSPSAMAIFRTEINKHGLRFKREKKPSCDPLLSFSVCRSHVFFCHIPLSRGH